MKTLKPLRLGVLTRPFENERRYYLSVGILVFFPFDQPERLLPEISMWKLIGAELGSEGVLDEVMPKSSAEVLLSARAFPRSPPQPSTAVRLRMGTIDRRFYVFGDRYWKLTGPTDPEPFTSMPITYAHAFGGEGYAKNPLGKGFKPVQGERGEAHPLPNIEDPKKLIRSTGDRPEPASFMPINIAWPQRTSKAGTYDDAWLKERYPGFPADFDWTFFNVAPEGQRFEEFLRGGEAFSLEGMHPEKQTQSSTLPTGVARCFINKKKDGEIDLIDVPTKIDTVWLFPEHERGVVIYRGVLPVDEDDATDVIHLLAAYEAAGKPKPLEHYRRALAERLDMKTALAVLRDRDLLPEMPPRGAHADEEVSDMGDLLSTNRLVLENARRGAQKQIDKAREEIKQQWEEHEQISDQPLDLSGLPENVPELEQPPNLEDVPDIVEAALKQADEDRKKAELEAAEMEKKTRALCAEYELDYDKMVADERERELKKGRRFSAKTQLENLEEVAKLAENAGMDASEVRALLADPGLIEKLVAVEAHYNEAYRRIAHHLPPTLAEGDRILGEELEAGAKGKQTFAGRDFTNLDLSGLNLEGIDFEAAFLEGTKLRGCNLAGANLRGAVLVRADLTGASLKGADMTNTNAGEAVLCGADLSGARLEHATLAKADFKGAKLVGAFLEWTDLTETRIEGADLSELHAKNLLLFRATLEDVVMRRADISKTAFVECTFKNVDLTEAICVGTVLMLTQGDGTRFDRADLRSLRAIKDASFAGSSFREARMEGANLRGCNLTGADFTDADLTAADLSEAKLEGAKMQRIKASDALFVRTDLRRADLAQSVMMQAILQKARVDGASFEEANLFRADLLRARGDQETSFKGAFVKRVRSVPERDRDA